MSADRILALAAELCAVVERLTIAASAPNPAPDGRSLEAAHHARVIVNNLRPLLEQEEMRARWGREGYD